MLVQLSYGGEVEGITGQNEIILQREEAKMVCVVVRFIASAKTSTITWNYVPHRSCGDLKIT